MKKPLIEIGYDKNGEIDFGVLGTVGELNSEEMNELRSMTMVAIGVAEETFMRGVERRNPTSTVKEL